MIDSHCHLADEKFAADLEAVVARAKAAGVDRALVILEAGKDRERTQAERLKRLWPETRVAIGVHPHVSHEYADDSLRAVDITRRQLETAASARAIGEIGLDYHCDLSPREVQRDTFAAGRGYHAASARDHRFGSRDRRDRSRLSLFRGQLRLARERQLPVVIHTREAEEDTLAIIREEGGREVRGVLHCFTGSPALAASGLDLGFYISFAGIITFPKAAELKNTARVVPLDRLLGETDSPFLAPVPHRGKRNEPAYLAEVFAALADLKGIAVADLARQTTANFHTLFCP